MVEEFDTKTTDVLRNMCRHNPPSAQPTYKDKKADLMYKCVFCDFTYSTCVCTTRACTSYMCIYIYDIKAPSFLEPHFVSADLAIRGLARVGRHLHKWPGIHQGAPCPVKHKYHLPLTPLHKLCVFFFKFKSKFVTT